MENEGKSTFQITAHNGMSLRDYFAAKVLQGLMSNTESYNGELILASIEADLDQKASMAALAYKFADAMLLERAKC